MQIYKEIISAKDGSLVPVFASGRAFHSKYNPQREAQQLSENTEKQDFFIVSGLGGGYHLKSLMEKFPESRFLVVENSDEDIAFVKENIPLSKELLEADNVSICTLECLYKELLLLYIPAIYSTLQLFQVNSWLQEIDKEQLIHSVNEALKEIGRDFSVQAHFGKLWFCNILNNLKHVEKQKAEKLPVEKKCVVTAAGPSLDSKIQELKATRNNIFLIATDTSFKTLLSSGLTPDAVVSIDGQMISYRHFSKNNPEDTLYIFDLMANASAVNKIRRNNGKLLFTVSNHPFEQLLSSIYPDCFPEIDSSSGTVTIAALDFALKAGFIDIQILGADFGYLNNKAYAKGTYLDSIYYGTQDKTHTAEKEFTHLVYRTELIKKENDKFTTETLENYEKALYQWCHSKKCIIEKQNDCFSIKATEQKKNFSLSGNFCYKSFIKKLSEMSTDENMIPYLLPYISWLKNKDSENGISRSFEEYSKLALNFILRYTYKYEEK